ncbi:MAG: YdiU family protein [Rhodobacterales bacterium]|nr:YdiU family protein [Rhodobacterales bacterium]
MAFNIPFDNSYVTLPDRFYTRLDPTPVKAPELLRFNAALAGDLGITAGSDVEMARVFAGNDIPAGAAPLAQAYAGHQFGNYNPRLGDGRANLLGEVNTPNGRFDIQLKGTGPTPYSRSGDGRAWLGPVLREYVVSEAMHAMGIPTTRALAAVTTGEDIWRETALPGAILTRVARSHIRVGTFQYFAAKQDKAALQTLTDYAIARHFPQAQGPLEFLVAVIDRQAKLIAHWMSVGFIHGVMNTDNTQIAGETIDYGPCAFMDVYHPVTVFSSIDRQGRYAFDNQEKIIVWNMAQLANSLLLIMPDLDKGVADFTTAIEAMPAKIHAHWCKLYRAKIGLATDQNSDVELINDLLKLMADNGADFTNTFRALGRDDAAENFIDRDGYDAWRTRWQARLQNETNPAATMNAANPAYIPRNHRIEIMIEAAVAGDFAPFNRLLRVLATPFSDQADADDLRMPPKGDEVVQQTFCGT